MYTYTHVVYKFCKWIKIRLGILNRNQTFFGDVMESHRLNTETMPMVYLEDHPI